MSDTQNSYEELSGFVDHIIFRNEENGYTVLILDNDITVTGIFPSISDGESLRLWGNFVFHEVYGKQFQAQSFEIVAPKDEDDIRRYLGSGAIKGIGPALAKRIVDKFGEATFDIMEREPERLAEVRGISERKATEIADIVLEKTRDRAAILFLMKYGIKNNLAMRIYKYYGMNIYKVLETNPYRLAEDIRGVGFKMADEIASKTGIRYDEEYRIKSGIIYLLNQNSVAGHTYVPADILMSQSEKLLGADNNTLNACLMQLSIEKKIVIRGDQIYLSFYYRIEQECASMLIGLDVSFDEDEKYVEKYIEKKSSEFEIELDIKQREAVKSAISRGVMVLTGGPGTGKTTTIRTIIDYFESLGNEVALCAPTGRAAKRMTESTKREAMTIHRLLEVNGAIESDDERIETNLFSRGADYPLDVDMIIVDEASMVDISLFYYLLKATPRETRLILVGDADQLPSVGPGNVLRDIIDSGRFRVVRLENIFRQENRSDIVINAHKIQKGERIELDNNSKDFFFLKRDDTKSILTTMLTLITKKLPDYVDAKEGDIQVLTPTRMGNFGVINLNNTLQKYLNPKDDSKAEHTFGERTMREGDKVMQIKNDYRLPWRIEGALGHVDEEGLGIFNGDTGIIKSISEFAKQITVQFEDGRIVDYNFNQVDEIEHAFSVTVHKSQGSEYPAVIIPLMNVPRMLMNRNLIYTAITRAKKCVVLVGDESIFHMMVENNTVLNRYSGLKEAILDQTF